MIDSFEIFISCTLHIICRVRIVIIFSVTRRSRSHGSESLSHSNDEEDEEDEEDEDDVSPVTMFIIVDYYCKTGLWQIFDSLQQ